MKKKLICSVLVLALCISLVACGSSGGGEGNSTDKNEATSQPQNAIVFAVEDYGNISGAKLIELLGEPNEIAESTCQGAFDIPCVYYEYYDIDILGEASFVLVNDQVVRLTSYSEYPYGGKNKVLGQFGIEKAESCALAADTNVAVRYRCPSAKVDDFWVNLIDGDSFGFLQITYDMEYYEEWYLPMSISEQSDYQYWTQEYVKSILKSPKSADFPNISDWALVKNNFYVAAQSYVDAVNSFGAEVRSKFTFIYLVGTSTPIYAVFDGELIVDNGYVPTEDLVKLLVEEMAKETPAQDKEQIPPTEETKPVEGEDATTEAPTPAPETHTHSYGSWEYNNESNHYRTCSSCQESEYETHKWDDGTVTQAATCNTGGVVKYSCAVCNAEKFGSIQTVDHKWGDGVITQSPTCSQEGVVTYSCTNCGTTKNSSIPTVDHKWDNGAVTQAATCQKEGVATYSCTDCDAERYESIPMAAHEFTQQVEDSKYLKSRASYTSGSVYYLSCVCGEKGTDTFTINDKKEWISAEKLQNSYGYSYAWMGEYIWLARTDWDTNTRYDYKIYGSPSSRMESGVIYEGDLNGCLVRFKSEPSNSFGAGLMFYYDDLVAAGIIENPT